MKTAVICIGDELLYGAQVNTNATTIDEKLTTAGIGPVKIITVGDNIPDISWALQQTWQKYHAVIVTGGLGPTDDDLTRQAFCEFFKVEPRFNQDVMQEIEHRFKLMGKQLSAINKRQAMVPDGFNTLANSLGTAPGLHLQQNGYHLFSVPGVPRECEHLLDTHILPMLTAASAQTGIFSRVLNTYNIPESELGERIEEAGLPAGVKLSYLPRTGRVDLRFYGSSRSAVQKAARQVQQMLPDNIWGVDQHSPYATVHHTLLERHITFSVAESCTGGMVAQMLTQCAGSSGYFLGGAITYTAEMKSKLLGVDNGLIALNGEVSSATAVAMAKGMRQVAGSDYAGSITGIAGPGGGTDQKPVGTVHIAVAGPRTIVNKQLALTGNRDMIRIKAAEALLLLLLKVVR